MITALVLTGSFSTSHASDLITAVRNEDEEAVKTYIEGGFNVNFKNALGESPLHYAVIHQNISILTLLLNAGADVNIQDNNGESPLHCLAHHQETHHTTSHDKTIDLLISAGADIYLQDNGGIFPAMTLEKIDTLKTKDCRKELL